MYTKLEIINEVAVQVKQIDQLYKSRIINYKGKTVDTDEHFTEVIAEELLKIDIKKRLENINEVVREKGYRVVSHNGVVTPQHNEENSNRKEERYAIQLFNLSKGGKVFNHIGRILDYQIPLKNSIADKGLGKIDLISVTDEHIFLLELKIKENEETILRCLLEISTYYQQLSKSKFLDSYSNEFGKLTENSIKKAILIVNSSPQHKEMEELRSGERRYLKMLMDALEVEVFCMDPESQYVQKL